MPTAANRKPVTRLQARTQLTFTEPSTVDPTQEQEQQPASDIEDSDSEVTLRLPEPTFEQPSLIIQPTATPARQSGMESFIKYYGTFDGSDDNAAYEFLIDLEHYAKAHKLKDEDVVLGFPTLLRGNAKRWFIHSEIDKTNIKTITDAFKSRFLNPSKCSTATLFQQKQRVGENVQDYITSMRATAARLGTPDRQVLEAIMDGFLPEIREKVIMKDPRTLEDLESAAVLSETARSNPAFRTDSSNTCQAGNSKSELQTLVQAMSELIKTQNYSIQAIQSQGGRNFNQNNFQNSTIPSQNSKFVRQNQNFQRPNSFSTSKPYSNYTCYSCNKPGHFRSACRYRDAICNWCGLKGHISTACVTTKRSAKPSSL